MNSKTGYGIGCLIEIAFAVSLAVIAGEERFNPIFDWMLALWPISLVVRWVMHAFFGRRGLWDAALGPSFMILAIIIGLLRPVRLIHPEDEKTAAEPKPVETAKPAASAGTPAAKPPAAPKPSLEEALAELDALTGLEGVKAEVRKIVNKVRVDKARTEQGLKVAPRSLHMVFTGNPGTGKTTVARIVAKIFRALDLVGNDLVVEVDRSGLIGQYMGETAVKTNRKIDEAVGIPKKFDSSGKERDLTARERAEYSAKAPGGVLFIDEAYQIVSSKSDDYGKEAVATILKRMEDERGKLIVIAAGYTDEMREFLAANSGFKSRFGIQLEFADFTTAELAKIFRQNAAKAQYRLSPELDRSLDSIIAKLTARRDRTFGNGRFVRQLFEDATGRQADRLAEAGTLEGEALVTLEVADLGVGQKQEDIRAPKLEEVLAELDSLTGMKAVKDEVKRLVATVKANRLREQNGLDKTELSYNFVFTGNPGTGKTTVARIIAKAFRALGILDRGHLVETDRSGLVAEYTGQTAPKTNRLIDSAKGGILFIDEAYQLNQGQGDQFGAEAVATLLKRMEDECGQMVIIVAGYKEEMSRFMAINSGLESRFNRTIEFPDYSAEELAEIFRSTAKRANYVLSKDSERWIGPFIGMLTKDRGKNFGNGRWARNLFEKSVERQALRISELKDPTREQLVTLTLKDIGISLKDPDASKED